MALRPSLLLLVILAVLEVASPARAAGGATTSTLAVGGSHTTTVARPLLSFRGNVVLADEVYRALLNLPKSARATPGLARKIRSRILAFLHRAGYDLAAVRAEVEGDQIALDIDEGRLNKVIFLNEGTVEQIRLHLQFGLPHDVFNRPMLERQLRELSRQFNLKRYEWRLVPSRDPKETGPSTQIETLEPLPNVELIPQQREYELHILLERQQWEAGYGLDASINGLEGVGVGVHYLEGNLLLPNDRWEARGRIAGNLRSNIDGSDTRPVLQAALLEGRWYTPPILKEAFRPFVNLRAYYLDRQRGDLGLNSFKYLPLEASINLGYTFKPDIAVSLGLGFEHRRIFDLHPIMGASPVVFSTPDQQSRFFSIARVEYVLNPDEIRRDRKHEIDVEGRAYDHGVKMMDRLTASYQKPTLIGWHELWIKIRGTLLGGDVLFPDEEPTGGDYLRGAFSSTFYVRKIASLSLELRVSLVRDLFKVSVYHDLAVFGAQDAARTSERSAVADAFGAGIHVMIIDAFELDAYYGVGFATRAGFDRGFTLAIRQAY